MENCVQIAGDAIHLQLPIPKPATHAAFTQGQKQKFLGQHSSCSKADVENRVDDSSHCFFWLQRGLLCFCMCQHYKQLKWPHIQTCYFLFLFCLRVILWTCKMLTELLSQPQTNLSSRLHWNYFCSLKPSVCQQQSYYLGNFVTCIVLHCFIPYAPCPYYIYSYLISDGPCVVTDVDHWTLSFRGQINAM